jgi:hypothetical protein
VKSEQTWRVEFALALASSYGRESDNGSKPAVLGGGQKGPVFPIPDTNTGHSGQVAGALLVAGCCFSLTEKNRWTALP